MVSQNKGTPILTPKYYSPYCWDPLKWYPLFWETPIWGFGVHFRDFRAYLAPTVHVASTWGPQKGSRMTSLDQVYTYNYIEGRRFTYPKTRNNPKRVLCNRAFSWTWIHDVNLINNSYRYKYRTYWVFWGLWFNVFKVIVVDIWEFEARFWEPIDVHGARWLLQAFVRRL